MSLQPAPADVSRPPQITRGEISHDLAGTAFHPLSWRSTDGLCLSGRDYGDAASSYPPLLCLPGLTRNARDFEPVAAYLTRLGFRVIVAESRGRGQSEWDPVPANYTPLVEMIDMLGLVDGLGLTRISGLGTSRGGILMMLAATVRPGLFSRSILNDVGPRLELDGLLKIKGYVGRALAPTTWEKAIFALSVSQGTQFPRLDDAGWERYARRLWRDDDGVPTVDYDPALSVTVATLSPETQMVELWDQFAALAEHPVLLLRGTLSDILSLEAAHEMVGRHATVKMAEIQDQGHAPLLDDAETLGEIARFLQAG